jgi:hypothetical protein
MKRSLRSWLWRVPLDQEFDEEIELHIEMRTRELVAGGMDPKDARAAAIKKMGDVRSLKRECVDLGRKRDREMQVTLFLEELRDDIRFAFRQLSAAPAFTLVATLTLALGIGANSAIFALVDATLLRPLPYPNPERLVTIWEKSPATARGFASPPNMLDWQSRSRTFEKIAGSRRASPAWFSPHGRHGRNNLATVGDCRDLDARCAADRRTHVLF